MSELGERIRLLAAKRDLKIVQVARKIGMKESTFTGLVNKAEEPKFDAPTLRKLSDVLGVSCIELLGCEGACSAAPGELRTMSGCINDIERTLRVMRELI